MHLTLTLGLQEVGNNRNTRQHAPTTHRHQYCIQYPVSHHPALPHLILSSPNPHLLQQLQSKSSLAGNDMVSGCVLLHMSLHEQYSNKKRNIQHLTTYLAVGDGSQNTREAPYSWMASHFTFGAPFGTTTVHGKPTHPATQDNAIYHDGVNIYN
ncbi:hypothetical protein E2C01_008430 [Portunus trituberculatus]|uniref:Uncharacterized protein n=1 Tax=Portunus trituberculatus TaxID=210409 RepID=A0A5B7D0S1_PORTR|nr:hypothetical protein [Portunus trituberculatus]